MAQTILRFPDKNVWKVLIRTAFVVWIVAITVLAVVPHADDGIMVASNITPSGMEKHVVGYFVGALLYIMALSGSGILLFGFRVW